MVEKTGIYCSRECKLADRSLSNYAAGAFNAILGLVSILIAFTLVSSPSSRGEEIILIPVGILMVFASIFGIYEALQGRQYRNRKDKFRETQRLDCQYCSHINPPDILKCQNCGASLSEAEFA
jgi:hypothetical protein